MNGRNLEGLSSRKSLQKSISSFIEVLHYRKNLFPLATWNVF